MGQAFVEKIFSRKTGRSVKADDMVEVEPDIVMSHDNTTYGAFGAFSTGIGRSEVAVIFATGKTWFRIPESQKIIITGQLPDGIVSKDVILHIIGDMGADSALYQSVEFWGDTL